MLLASEARRITETRTNDDLSWLDEEIYAACKDGVTTITFTCLPEAIEEIERCGYTIKDRLRLTSGFDLITIEW